MKNRDKDIDKTECQTEITRPKFVEPRRRAEPTSTVGRGKAIIREGDPNISYNFV